MPNVSRCWQLVKPILIPGALIPCRIEPDQQLIPIKRLDNLSAFLRQSPAQPGDSTRHIRR
jgi:hypothetical protein